ncbi:MAG: FAD-binding protein [Phycisphaerae bacterium]|nr:FAD-binding protein [Phycisphaerae bacterium]NUQ47225.1 FAD-binding protein [Phycisphaerae bacterium]
MTSALLQECADVCGSDAVVAEPAALLTYETDAFTLLPAAPEAVVFPRDTAQAAGVMRVLHRHGVPIVPRGAGTSLAGGTVAVDGGVCVCTSRMRDILCINRRDRWARVQAGVVNLRLSREPAVDGWQFAPDPSSQMVSTIGGNAATNAGGPHTLKLGVTTNHVLGVTLVLPDGQVAELGGGENAIEDVPGFDLRALAVGSEGTLGLITEITVRLTRVAPAVHTALAVFHSIDDAAEAISGIIAAGILPAALEMIDRLTLQCVEEAFGFGFPRDAGAVLIVELDGMAAGLERQAERAAEICRRRRCREIRVAHNDEERAELWKCRKKAFGAYGRFGKACCTQDGVVPRTRIPDIVRFVDAVSRRFGLTIAMMMHAGDGNVHPVLMYDADDADQVRRVLDASSEILRECVRLGGTITGEHGVGIEKTEHLREMFGAADLAAQRTIRDVFDPDRRCNPHKVLATGAACLERLRPAKGIAP